VLVEPVSASTMVDGTATLPPALYALLAVTLGRNPRP